MTQKLSYDQYEVIRKLYAKFDNSSFIYKDAKEILSRRDLKIFSDKSVLVKRGHAECFTAYERSDGYIALAKHEQFLWTLNNDYIKVALK
jgi:hypothetical protein